jgi:O-antigen ligase
LIHAQTATVGRIQSRALVSRILILIISGALWIGIQPVVERFVLSPEGAEERASIWEGSVQIIRDHPLLGVGAGMHGWAYTRYKNRNYDYFYDHVHNDYLQAAAEWGLPAAIVFFGMIISMIWRAGKRCLRAINPVRAGLIAGGIFFPGHCLATYHALR